MVDPPVFLARQLFLLDATRPGPHSCHFLFKDFSPLLVDLQGLPLVSMSFFIFIFYRTGLPLVSPATLEPMGLPTDFKLLPKVELITSPHLVFNNTSKTGEAL